MRLEIRRINHNRLRLGFRSRQAIHHPHENAHVAPTLPAIVERFVRTVFPGRITPAHTIAVHKNDAAQHTAVINARFAVALGKKRPQTFHLFVRQPKQVAHLQSPHRA
ncbi:hypothetical protein A0J51_03154 [Gluconobacter japonicus]|nr:hypothetical protein A0J51_03154 [Gluconobacter japonicus]